MISWLNNIEYQGLKMRIWNISINGSEFLHKFLLSEPKMNIGIRLGLDLLTKFKCKAIYWSVRKFQALCHWVYWMDQLDSPLDNKNKNSKFSKWHNFIKILNGSGKAVIINKFVTIGRFHPLKTKVPSNDLLEEYSNNEICPQWSK